MLKLELKLKPALSEPSLLNREMYAHGVVTANLTWLYSHMQSFKSYSNDVVRFEWTILEISNISFEVQWFEKNW